MATKNINIESIVIKTSEGSYELNLGRFIVSKEGIFEAIYYKQEDLIQWMKK